MASAAVSFEKKQTFSVTLFGDSGCFLPLYVAPFSDEQIEQITRYQRHPDYIGVSCYSCIRKEKLTPKHEGMVCMNCGTVYVWAYGMLTREEAEAQAEWRYNRPLSEQPAVTSLLRRKDLRIRRRERGAEPD